MAKKPKNNRKKNNTIGELCRVLGSLAPLELAQSWDNVGLLAGNRGATVQRALLCIDLTPDVVAEAVKKRVQLIVAYHPPIFKPIKRLTLPSDEMDGVVLRCLSSGIAIYSMHTALDAAVGGTNDVIAAHCDITEARPLEYADVGDGDCKVVVFAPPAEVDRVAEAMFAAGAGWIGDYAKCSYRIAGRGTFFGGENTKPTVGEPGKFETVDEIRVESVTPRDKVPAVIEAIRRTHSYEEPAFDVYPLEKAPRGGIGRYGSLRKSTTLTALARKLKRETGSRNVQVVGVGDCVVKRAIVCVGAAGSLPFNVCPGHGDVIVTGEIRHHDALAIRRRDACAVALGHWASERPVLEAFAKALATQAPRLQVVISEADRDPFAPVG